MWGVGFEVWGRGTQTDTHTFMQRGLHRRCIGSVAQAVYKQRVGSALALRMHCLYTAYTLPIRRIGSVAYTDARLDKSRARGTRRGGSRSPVRRAHSAALLWQHCGESAFCEHQRRRSFCEHQRRRSLRKIGCQCCDVMSNAASAARLCAG